MAKRKRLSPAILTETPAAAAAAGSGPELGSALEVKSYGSAPIAGVTRNAAATAALLEIEQAMKSAQAKGRMVLEISLDKIKLDHLVRDRLPDQAADEDMAALIESIRARGQQTPVEVVDLPLEQGGGYGLISGWRRCQAIAQIAKDDGHDPFVLALLRRPAEASDAYQAMVEENEIRVGLSYYERARIAVKAVEEGVFETDKAALLTLFRSASKAKRSKIRRFLPLVRGFDGLLRFPAAITERLGLALSQALDRDAGAAEALRAALADHAPATAEEEAALLTQVLSAPAPNASSDAAPNPDLAPVPSPVPSPALPPGAPHAPPQTIAAGVLLTDHGDGTLTLSGPALTADFASRLRRWIADNA